jgi:hypothetical protein
VLREAVPVPVYTPPPEVTEGLLAIGKKGGARGKQRRKSDVVLLRRGVDHTVVMPSEMPLSSLVAVALRQVYDGFAALAAGHGHVGRRVDVHVAGWLSAVVEGCEDMPSTVASASAATYSSVSSSTSSAMSGGSQGRGQGPGLLDALESTQPQLALAAEQGRGFLCALLTFPAVQHYLEEEGGESEGEDDRVGRGSGSLLSGSGKDSGRDGEGEDEGASGLWAIVREASAMVAAQGMSEDRHLCLFRGGWKVH